MNQLYKADDCEYRLLCSISHLTVGYTTTRLSARNVVATKINLPRNYTETLPNVMAKTNTLYLCKRVLFYLYYLCIYVPTYLFCRYFSEKSQCLYLSTFRCNNLWQHLCMQLHTCIGIPKIKLIFFDNFCSNRFHKCRVLTEWDIMGPCVCDCGGDVYVFCVS